MESLSGLLHQTPSMGALQYVDTQRYREAEVIASGAQLGDVGLQFG